MNIELEKRRRANILRNLIDQPAEQKNSTTVETKQFYSKAPLAIQVKNHAKIYMNEMEFQKLFYGRNRNKEAIIVYTLIALYLAIFGFLMEYFDKYFFETKTVLILLLLNGFHILGLNVKTISKNSDFALLNLICILIFLLILLHFIIFGSILSFVLQFSYVIWQVKYYFLPKDQKAPTQIKYKSLIECIQFSFLKLISFKYLKKKLLNFLIFVIPVSIVLFFISCYQDIKFIEIRQILKLLYLDYFLMRLTEKCFRVINKYKVKVHLLQQYHQLPLFLYPLCLQEDQPQELAALQFLFELYDNSTALNMTINFRLEQQEPPKIKQIVQSYFSLKFNCLTDEIIQLGSQLNYLSGQVFLRDNLMADITVIVKNIKNYYHKHQSLNLLLKKLHFYNYLSRLYQNYTNQEIIESIEYQKNNIRILKCIESLNKKYRENQQIISLQKTLVYKLPSISQNQIYSPFRYPSDEEVFLYRENDRLRKQESKNMQDMRIWEKKTASNRTQLKHFKNYDTQLDDKFISKTAYTDKEKKVITDALSIVKDRQKQREKGVTKEPVVTLLDQKKEMFLVSKAHGIIEEEIGKLKQMIVEKQEALDQSEKMLDLDNENFQKYVDQNKQQKLDAEMRAELEIKEKKAKEAEIKSINIKITSLRAEKTRNEEAVNNYMDHKKFLDKLAPKEWHDQKEKKRQQLISKLKEEYLKTKGNNEKQFYALVEAKKFDELEEFEDDYEMYFKSPSQLVEIFNDLEERNLFLIQTTQDAEQNLEELKTKFNKIKQNLDDKMFNLVQTKEIIKKNYESVVSQIKLLQQKGAEKDTKKDHKELRKQIIEVYELFQGEIQGIHDIQSKETIEILVAIELHLEKQLKQIRLQKPDRVEFYRQECDRVFKQNQRDENNKRLKLENEIRIKNNQAKLMQPSKKKTGRMHMFRSKPFDRIEAPQDDPIDDQELEDQKYFIE